MKVFLSITLTLLFSSQAYSLGATNCSNFDGTSTRIEEETWGANIITYTFEKKEIEVVAETFKDQFILQQSTEGGVFGETKVTTYSALYQWDAKEFEQPITQWMLCQSWENDGID